MKSVPPAALPQSDRVEVVAGGLLIGPELVPLWAASVDYFSVDPAQWRDVLGATRALGFRLIEVRVPWALHETASETFDFGAVNPALDVVKFLHEAARFGLYGIVHLGPRQERSPDLREAGIPRHLLWDPEVHAATPKGNPLIVPELLGSSPEPSWFSDKYTSECAHWMRAVARCLTRMVYPSGPIVMVELGSRHDERLFERTSGDFRAEALTQYREHLTLKYERVANLRRAHGVEIDDFSAAMPPSEPISLGTAPDAAYLDWFEFLAASRAEAYARFRGILNEEGFDSAVLVLPRESSERQQTAEPVIPRANLSMRASAPAAHATALASVGFPVGALGAQPLLHLKCGFACDSVPVSESEQAFQALWALAHGVCGFTASPVVERQRFIGGLLDRAASPKPAAEFWASLLEAAERCQLYRLKPENAVRVVLPARLRLLAAAQQTLKPADPSWLGLSAYSGSLSVADGAHAPSGLLAAMRFYRQLSDVLSSLRIPYSLGTEASFDQGLSAGEWTIILCADELPADLLEGVRFAISRGHALSFGPSLPESFILEVDSASTPPLLLPPGRSDLERCVKLVQAARQFSSIQAEPAELEVSIHRAAGTQGGGAVLFAVNPTQNDQAARVSCPGYDATDALNRQLIHSFAERLEFAVPARTVRMLELRPNS